MAFRIPGTLFPTWVMYVQYYPVVIASRCTMGDDCCRRVCAVIRAPGSRPHQLRCLELGPDLSTIFSRGISWTIYTMPPQGKMTPLLYCRRHGVLAEFIVKDDRVINSWYEGDLGDRRGHPDLWSSGDDDVFGLQGLFDVLEVDAATTMS